MKLAAFTLRNDKEEKAVRSQLPTTPDRNQQLQIGLIQNDTIQHLVGFQDLFRGESVRSQCLVNRLIADWDEPNITDRIAAIDSEPINLNEVRLHAPVPHPQKIICVGRNYAAHATEMGSEVADLPVIFNKFPNAIADPDSSIALPPQSEAVDYEAELVVVIGRQGKHIDQANAMDYVFGYCCGNDVSARDWQKGKPGGQWLLGKTFDSFAPIGPWIATKDEVNPEDLDIELRLNGQSMQQANTSSLIFGIGFLIAHLSTFVTLCPGDLLFTGTPAGVGAGRKPPVFLKPGDETTVEISGLGRLHNTFVEEETGLR